MTTYVYETVPSKPGQKPRYFEIKQNMKDAPLRKHPENGEPIRRVVLGGFGVLKSGAKTKFAADAGSCGCGPGGCCN
jgi:predicted nucleic acid-binding Zn ribbon protein